MQGYAVEAASMDCGAAWKQVMCGAWGGGWTREWGDPGKIRVIQRP